VALLVGFEPLSMRFEPFSVRSETLSFEQGLPRLWVEEVKLIFLPLPVSLQFPVMGFHDIIQVVPVVEVYWPQ
jgi:hypothetical protein